MHERHDGQEHEQVDWQQGYRQMVGQNAEKRRHEHRADVGGCHLDADDRLRLVPAEVCRSRVDDAGINRRTAKPNQDQASQCERLTCGEHHRHDAEQDQHLPHPDHALVVHAHREKAIDGAAHRDADEEHRAKTRCLFRRDAPAEIQEAARPETAGLLDGTVAEKGDQYLTRARYPENLAQRERLALVSRICLHLIFSLLPERQAGKQDNGQDDLHHRDDMVARRPALPHRQRHAHDVRSCRRTDAPHAVQPAHMPAPVVKRHIIVQRGIHTAGAEPIGNGPETEHPKLTGYREAKQGRGRHGDADGCHLPRAEPERQPVALQARDDRPEGNDHRDDARIRQRRP